MERQDPYGDLEDEGIPELEDPPPGTGETGGDYEALVAPRDWPLVADDYGTTAREQRVPEPADIRARRELPDVPSREDDRRAGRLVADVDNPGLEVALATDDTLGLSAEEAAIHIIPE